MTMRPLRGEPRAHPHGAHTVALRGASQRKGELSAPAAHSLCVSQNATAHVFPKMAWGRGTNAALVTPVLRLGDGVLTLGLRRAGFRAFDVDTCEGTVRLWDAPGQNPTGPVMVLLHGLAGSSREMGSPLGALQHFASRVVAVDTPSHGSSFLLGEQASDLLPGTRPHACIERMARAVIEGLDGMLEGDARSVVLCGHSLGGYLAARYVLEGRHGARSRLQLVEPDGAPWTDDEVARGRAAMDVRSTLAARALAHDTFPTRPLRAALTMPFLWARFAAAEVRYLVHSDAFQPVLTPAQLAALPADTLLIRGQHERFNAPHTLDYLQAHLPAGHPVSFPETGHGDLCCADPEIMEAIEAHALTGMR